MAKTTYALTDLSIGEALNKSWDLVKDRWKDIAMLAGAFLVAGLLPSYLVDTAFKGEGVGPLLSILLQIWQVFLSIGLTKGMLTIARGGSIEVPAIYQNQEMFIEYFIMYLRYLIVVVGGLILFVIPGLYFALRYMFVMTLVVDGKATGAEAFEKSKAMTDGNMTFLISYTIVGIALFLIGMLALMVGSIVAAVVVGFGMILIYEYLLSQKK